MFNIEKFQFLQNNKAVIPEVFNYFIIKNKKIKNDTNLNINQIPKAIYISLYPTFLETEIVNNDNYTLKKVNHKGQNGVGILLNEEHTAESYLRAKNKRQLKNVRRDFRRLEESFKTIYEYNCGNISNEKCVFLLKALHKMIVNRFENKKETHLFLKDWDFKTHDLANLINRKKASLFVIYADDKPISISLNWHEKNSILFSETHSYDTDFSEYSLGHLDFYMLLDWSLKNKFDFLDLGRGDYSHKKKWCNTFYNFEYRLYYDKKSIKSRLVIYFEIFKIKTKNIIKSFIMLFNKNFNK